MTRKTPDARRQWLALTCLFVASAVLLAVESGFSQDPAPRSDTRVDEVRRDLQRYAQRVQQAKDFFALPPERQEAMRRLDDDLSQLQRGERERLLHAMKWYSEWLEKLSPQDREAILQIADGKTRLLKIKEQIERTWIARQPKGVRDLLARPATPATTASLVGMLAAPPNQRPMAGLATMVAEGAEVRAETIKRLKRQESKHARDWQVASRFWQDLTDPDPKKRPAMPVQAKDFGPEVELFVKEYLRPVLSENELKRLDKAEGQWPLYPMTLVELADRHPMALPQKHGPENLAALPTLVRERVKEKWEKFSKGKKDPAKAVKEEAYFHNQSTSPKSGVAKRIEKVEHNASPATKFACAVATFLHNGNSPPHLPFELWVATEDGLAQPMKAFLDRDGPFWTTLTNLEREELKQVQNQWPEYPLKIKQLADKYGFKPPWQSLPEPADPKHIWEKYRVRQLTQSETALPARQEPLALVELQPINPEKGPILEAQGPAAQSRSKPLRGN